MRLAFALYGQPAGIIERSGGRVSLHYRDDYLNQPDPTPLSLSMPVSSEAYPARPVGAYLRGLLPDNAAVRERWATAAQVRPGNTLGLIAYAGQDVAGGAIFAPNEKLADALTRPGGLIPASESDIAARLRGTRADDAAWRAEDFDEHWSLAGAQAKFTLARTAQGWAFATGSSPSTHIIKPGIGRIRAQALIEHVSMEAFRSAGLATAKTHYVMFEDQPAIVVERFDRRITAAGETLRIHQEDLLQSLALDPLRKYEADRGPGIQRISSLLRSVADSGSVARFTRAVIANQIIGAPDAHAKNYAVILAGRTATLAPLYDVATGLVPDANGQLRYPKGAMSVGGERGFGDVERHHWEKLARITQLPATDVLDWVAELAASIPSAFESAAAKTDAPESEFVLGEVLPNIVAVARQTLSNLAAPGRRNVRVQPFLQTLPGEATEA